jgi:myo-inositol-1(or 4)-monophosphatase
LSTSSVTSAAPSFVWIPKAEAIAREAGARLREFLLQGVVTEYKGDVDLVTIADRTVEKLIRTRLAEVFPDHGMFGEEGTRTQMEQEFRWYVDPLDGTTNFAHGVPQFCVSLGLEQRPSSLSANQDGTLVAGVIYDPMRDEVYCAERGKGAWLNGKQMHASRTPELAESLVSTGFPSRKRHENPNIHFYNEFTLRSHGVRRMGSAALDLAYVAGLLGVQSQPLGHRGRHSACGRSRRPRDRFRRQSLQARQPRNPRLQRPHPRRTGRFV